MATLSPLPDGWTLDRIATVSQSTTGASALDPSQYRVLGLVPSGDPILLVVRNLISVGGLVIALEDDDSGWWIGQEREPGTVECWGQYGDLEATLHSL